MNKNTHIKKLMLVGFTYCQSTQILEQISKSNAPINIDEVISDISKVKQVNPKIEGIDFAIKDFKDNPRGVIPPKFYK